MRSPRGRGRAPRRRRCRRPLRARPARALSVAGPPLPLLQRRADSGSAADPSPHSPIHLASGGMPLPPGPAAPAALQTYEWIARPTALLRRAQARYGEPFTLRTLWADAPMVLVSDPEDVRRVFTAEPGVLRGGESSSILEPFAGPSSILLLDGAEHLRQRRLMLPPFHGERVQAYRRVVADLAEAEVARWPAGVPFAALPRMQGLTLDVIMRAVFGAREEPA